MKPLPHDRTERRRAVGKSGGAGASRRPASLSVLLAVCLVLALAWPASVTAQEEEPSAAEGGAAEAVPTFVIGGGDTELRRSAIVQAVEQTGPAVVNINTEQLVNQQEQPFPGFRSPFFDDPFFRRFFEPNPRQYSRTSLGSGVIIDPEGYILTNEHVIAASTRITVTLRDGREFQAEPIGAVAAMDLAILRIESPEPLPTVRIGTSGDLMIGETVIAIGNPFGLSHTVTTGVISALHRSIRADEERVYSDFIQIDASINPGNSGGPLLNINGELIGINTAIYSEGQGIGFAIPINKALRVVNNLITYGEFVQGYCGIHVQDLNDALVKGLRYTGTYGVVVSAIDGPSPAVSAGMQQGDVIHAIGSEQVANILEFDRLLKEYPVGSDMIVHFYRGGQPGEVRMRMAEFPESLMAGLPWDRLGLRVEAVNRNVARRNNLAVTRGVMVTEIRPDSVAQRIGLRPRDVLLKVDNQPTHTVENLLNVLRTAYYQSSIFVVLQRGARPYHISIPLH